METLKQRFNYDQDFIFIFEEEDYFLQRKRKNSRKISDELFEFEENDVGNVYFVVDRLGSESDGFVGLLL